MHYVMLETGEGGERLKACQPELNWSKGSFYILPLSKFLLFFYAGGVASTKCTRFEWIDSDDQEHDGSLEHDHHAHGGLVKVQHRAAVAMREDLEGRGLDGRATDRLPRPRA